MRDGRGGTSESHRLHSGNTGDPSRRRGVCGPVEPGDPTVGDTCEVQKEGSPQVENRKGMVLRIPSADISRRWLGGYEGLETLPGIVGTAMLGVSAAEMMLGTVVRMSVLYAWKGPGPWMVAALWSTAFQVVIMPCRWALEWGREQGEAIAQAMEAKVGGANLPIDGGGTGSINRN